MVRTGPIDPFSVRPSSWINCDEVDSVGAGFMVASLKWNWASRGGYFVFRHWHECSARAATAL